VIMTSGEDDFDSVRAEPDPVRRGQRATRLLNTYQQRAVELARLRRAAIEEAHRDRGLSYTEIAEALGITKGRITQIRDTAPLPERAFFGTGPVSIGIPYRYRVTDRERPLIAAEDAQTGEQLEHLLTSLAFAVTRYQIEPERTDPPPGDTVVVCGPKSAVVGAALMARDPALGMTESAGRWLIEDRRAGQVIGSPADEDPAQNADIAYLARHVLDGQVVVHIAGIHAIGSLGAADYLTSHLDALFAHPDLFTPTGEQPFSAVIRASFDGLTITHSGLVAGPYPW
jgi:hypothetical protein